MNIFIGRDQVWLECELKKLQQEFTSLTMSVGAGDTSTSKKRDLAEIERRIEQLLRALNKLDPVNYPFTDTRRITQTKASFA